MTDKLSREAAADRWTYADLAALPDDGKRHEIIDGEHFVTPSPNSPHQVILGNLYWMMRSWLEDHPVGKVLLSRLDVVLSKYDVVEPDLLYVSNERRDVLTRKNVQGAPDLVVEILSPSHRRYDEVVKRRLYERKGIAEYWIVDPRQEAVKVYRRIEGRFSLVSELSNAHGDELATPLLAGMVIPLRRLFAD